MAGGRMCFVTAVMDGNTAADWHPGERNDGRGNPIWSAFYFALSLVRRWALLSGAPM